MIDRRVRLRSFSVCVLAVVAAVTVACAPAPAPDPAGTPVQPPVAASGWQADMLAAVNAQRSAAGVPAVQLCGTLDRAAQAHSADQAATSTMSHIGSDGSTLRVRAERSGYVGWRGLAENVAAGQPDVTSVMGSWMNSSGHRTNLLNPSYTHLGVGRAPSGSGTLYWTQVFGVSGAC